MRGGEAECGGGQASTPGDRWFETNSVSGQRRWPARCGKMWSWESKEPSHRFRPFAAAHSLGSAQAACVCEGEGLMADSHMRLYWLGTTMDALGGYVSASLNPAFFTALISRNTFGLLDIVLPNTNRPTEHIGTGTNAPRASGATLSLPSQT